MQELFPGFSMPQGTYVMYSFEDILLGDAYNSLMLILQLIIVLYLPQILYMWHDNFFQ